MIGKIAKAVLKLILPDVTQHLMKVFKMDKLLSYMELENDADRGVKFLKDEMDMVKDQRRDMAKDTHPPVIDLKEWEDVKAIVNKLKNKKVFKSLG